MWIIHKADSDVCLMPWKKERETPIPTPSGGRKGNPERMWGFKAVGDRRHALFASLNIKSGVVDATFIRARKVQTGAQHHPAADQRLFSLAPVSVFKRNNDALARILSFSLSKCHVGKYLSLSAHLRHFKKEKEELWYQLTCSVLC